MTYTEKRKKTIEEEVIIKPSDVYKEVNKRRIGKLLDEQGFRVVDFRLPVCGERYITLGVFAGTCNGTDWDKTWQDGELASGPRLIIVPKSPTDQFWE